MRDLMSKLDCNKVKSMTHAASKRKDAFASLNPERIPALERTE